MFVPESIREFITSPDNYRSVLPRVMQRLDEAQRRKDSILPRPPFQFIGQRVVIQKFSPLECTPLRID